MSEWTLARILAGYAALIGGPTLGVAWLMSGRPRPPRPNPRTVSHTLVVCLWDRLVRYRESWVLAVREGMAAERLVAFVLSFGLLWRASVHSLVAAVAYPDGPPSEVDHGLTWTPLPMDRTPLWTARILTVGVGLTLAPMVGWPAWGWPAWAEWTARLYLFAQVGVWVAEPIAIVRDHVK